MTEAQSISAKYIFLDIVSYSHGRSVEAQTDIIATLNDLVRQTVAQFRITDEQLIYLPTGDGICIALLGVESPYDVHIQLPVALLTSLHAYNQLTNDVMRNFKIRIGVNTNIDNVVTDINGDRNVAGAGINLAQRVMNAGDANQILVGDSVFETLRYREKYMQAFKSFTTSAKHGIQLRVHQLVLPSVGLDISAPSQFRVEDTPELRLTRLAAHYFALTIKNKEFLKDIVRTKGTGQGAYTCVVLLFYLAQDSMEESSRSELDPPSEARTWGAGKATLPEQFEHYDSIDFAVISDLAENITDNYLAKFSDCFEPPKASFSAYKWHFITKNGYEKLRTDCPGVWLKFFPNVRA